MASQPFLFADCRNDGTVDKDICVEFENCKSTLLCETAGLRVTTMCFAGSGSVDSKLVARF